MRTPLPILSKTLAFFCSFILLVSGCSFGNAPDINLKSNPDGPHISEAQIISFEAQRTELQPGECTELEWQVEGGFGNILNGEEVDPTGMIEVCPIETTTFNLGVEVGDSMLNAQVTVYVRSSNEPQPDQHPPEEPLPEEPPPAGETQIIYFNA